jgi:hypothetical protein
MTSTLHHGTLNHFTLGDVFIRHRENMRELLEKHRESKDGSVDSFANTDGEVFFDCLSDEEGILRSSVLDVKTRECTKFDVKRRAGAISRSKKEDQETSSKLLSPPQPIRETSVALSDKFNTCVNIWTEISRSLSPSEQDRGDEDQRPGLSPLTVFSDDLTDLGAQDLRAQHCTTGDGVETLQVAKVSPSRRKTHLEHSPHLVPSPRSISSARTLTTFREPVLRTTERARSRNSSLHEDDGPSSPHRIPSTTLRLSISEPAKGIPGSTSPTLSPPRIKSVVHRTKTSNF